MPTRPYKKKYPKKDNKNTFLENDTANKEEIRQSCESNGKYFTANELDKLLLHTSDDLKLREQHCLFPAFNVAQAPIGSLNDLHLYPNCTISTPSAIYAASEHCERVDICHRRTMARDLFRRRIHISRTRYQTAQKVKKLRTNEKEGTYHTSLFLLAERLECDPDPYFHGSYDYYYTGGNLCVLGDGENVLHVDGKNLNNLNVGVLPKFKSFSSCFLDPVASHQLGNDDEVFEVSAIANIREDCLNSFAVRQRNSITLHTLRSTGDIKAITRFQTSSTPFISFAQSSTYAETFVVTTMKQSLRLYDLSGGSTPILSTTHELCARDDALRVSWNMIRPWQAQTYLYANERNFCLIDTRTTPEQWLHSSAGYKETQYECDFISSIAKSEFRNLAYVATNHKLHCLDVRYLRNDFVTGPAAVCHWTHQLEYAPAFFQAFRNGGSEFIALSSALADDMCVCELTREHEAQCVGQSAIVEAVADKSPDAPSRKCIYKSYCLPYKPPTLEDAYQRARISGKCLQPDADLATRIKRCSTGLAFYDTETFSECIGEDDCITFAILLQSNSIGDLYAHRLIERDVQAATAEREKQSRGGALEDGMHAYGKRVCDLMQPNLKCTEVVNLKGMRKVFRCNILSKPLNFDEDDKTKAVDMTRKLRGFGRWRKSIKTLHSYKDALAKDILSIWDVECADDEDTYADKLYSHIKRDLGVKPDPETIVSSWLDANIKPEEAKVPPPTPQRQLLPAITQTFVQTDRADNIMTLLHNNSTLVTAAEDANNTIKSEMENTLNAVESNFMDLDNTCSFSEFVAGPSTQQQSTQLLVDAIKQMPDSPTAQEPEEFISLRPPPKAQSKAVKKKSKYVKGF